MVVATAGMRDAEHGSLVGTFPDYVDNARQRDEPTYTSRWAHLRSRLNNLFVMNINSAKLIRTSPLALPATLVTGRKGPPLRWKRDKIPRWGEGTMLRRFRTSTVSVQNSEKKRKESRISLFR